MTEWIDRVCNNPRCDNIVKAHPMMSNVFCSMRCAQNSLDYLTRKEEKLHDLKY